MFKPPQGAGRWDNPSQYTAWYLGASQEAVIGEAFSHHRRWTDDMFDYPALPGSRRALCTFRLSEATPLCDLDDARALLDHGMRPTQVVIRNYPYTQAQALRIFHETNHDAARRWAGLRWWSVQRPQWGLVLLWNPPGREPPHEFLQADMLHIDHPAIIDAAITLAKERIGLRRNA